MGSSSETKGTVFVKVKMPDIQSLKTFSGMLKGVQRVCFAEKYGNILSLLEISVQVEALSALTQFYDPPMRCFTFQDFQLAPTIEEYEKILGNSLKNEKPYLYGGHYPSLNKVADVLRVCERELQAKRLSRSGIDGFPQSYLAERMNALSEAKDWVAFMEVLALTVYGIVLFPRLEGYIDFAAIDVFLARRDRRENPIPAILADTYYTLNFCYEKKGKRLVCCLPALYIWLVTRVAVNRGRASSPLEDFYSCGMKVKNGKEWAQHLRDLTGESVRWSLKWAEADEVIYQCGSFPNVPLLGTKGCINYNPSLVQRQLGYPMLGRPFEELIVPFVVYELDQQSLEMLKKVRHAWDRIIRKGRELRQRSSVARESYQLWIMERVQKIKLPFRGLVSVGVEVPAQTTVGTEDMEELKAALTKSEEKNRKLSEELKKMRQKCQDVQKESEGRKRSLEKANKRAREEEEHKLRYRSALEGATEELGLRNQEKRKALDEVQQLKDLYKNSKMAERQVRKLFEDLKQQLQRVVAEYEDRIRNERLNMEQIVAAYQDGLKNEQQRVGEVEDYSQKQSEVIEGLKVEVGVWKDNLAGLLSQANNLVKIMDNDSAFWRNGYMELAWLVKQAIAEIPRGLREADGMTNPLSTPIEICNFLEYCKELMVRLKKMTVVPEKEKFGCDVLLIEN